MIGIAPRPSIRPMNVLVTSKPWSPAATTLSHETRASPLRISVSRSKRPPSHGVSMRTSFHGGPASHASVRSFRTPNAGMRRRPSAHRWGSTRGASSLGTRTFDGMASRTGRRSTGCRPRAPQHRESRRHLLWKRSDDVLQTQPTSLFRRTLPPGVAVWNTISRTSSPSRWSLPTSISKKTPTGRSERRGGEGYVEPGRVTTERSSPRMLGAGLSGVLWDVVVAIFGLTSVRSVVQTSIPRVAAASEAIRRESHQEPSRGCRGDRRPGVPADLLVVFEVGTTAGEEHDFAGRARP